MVCKTEEDHDANLQVRWSESSEREDDQSDEAEIVCDSDREDRDKDTAFQPQVQSVKADFKFSFAANVNSAAQGIKAAPKNRSKGSVSPTVLQGSDDTLSNTDIAGMETEKNYMNLVAAKQGVQEEKKTPRTFERFLVATYEDENVTTVDQELSPSNAGM